MGCGASSQVAVEFDPNVALREELARLQAEIIAAEEEVRRLTAVRDRRRHEATYLDHTATTLSMRSAFTAKQLERVRDERENLLAHLAERDALGVEAASVGWGTDEKAMSEIIMGRTNWQLAASRERFLQLFGKSMDERVSSENRTFFGNLTGKMTPFGQVLVYRLQSPPERIAAIVRNAVQGLGADDRALIEVLSTSSNEELRSAARVYQAKHGESLTERVTKETSGMFSKQYAKWMQALCRFDRQPDGDNSAASDIALALYKAGAGRMMGVDGDVFITHLAQVRPGTALPSRLAACALASPCYPAGAECARSSAARCASPPSQASPSRCAAIEAAYEALSETTNTLRTDVERKFRGDLENAILARLTPRLPLLAQNLQRACAGLGSDKQAVARVFGTLSMREMPEFAATYNALFPDKKGGDALELLLDSETGGDFRAALRFLLRARSPTGNARDPEETEAMAVTTASAFASALKHSYKWEGAADVGRGIAADRPPHVVAANPERWHGAEWPQLPYVSPRGLD